MNSSPHPAEGACNLARAVMMLLIDTRVRSPGCCARPIRRCLLRCRNLPFDHVHDGVQLRIILTPCVTHRELAVDELTTGRHLERARATRGLAFCDRDLVL